MTKCDEHEHDESHEDELEITPKSIAAVVKEVVVGGEKVLDVQLLLEQNKITNPDASGTSSPHPCRTAVPLGHDLDGFVVDNVLTAAECEWLIERTETLGYSFWDARTEARKDFRNADTVEVIHPDMASNIWERLSEAVEPLFEVEEGMDRWQRDIEGTWKPYGTSEHVLFARYATGGHFAPHTDGFNIINFNERSMYTLIIYLNTCTDGGQTRFYTEEARGKLVRDEHDRFTSSPELAVTVVDAIQGRALLFHHDLVHEGVPVGQTPGAVKYIIRSDMMYERTPRLCDSPTDREAYALYMRAQELSNSEEAESIQESMLLFRKCFKMSPGLSDVFGM